MTKLLHKNGAEVDGRNQCGNAALHCAVRRGHVATANLLVDIDATEQ